MTVTAGQLYQRFGDPHKEANLALWYCPDDLRAENKNLPVKIYANRLIHRKLNAALYACQKAGVLSEIKSFGGCFNIRNIRGGGGTSLHSYAVALDWNVRDNPLGMTRTECLAAGLRPFTEKFAKCWEDNGWDWGGRWTGRPDLQHFQLASLD